MVGHLYKDFRVGSFVLGYVGIAFLFMIWISVNEMMNGGTFLEVASLNLLGIFVLNMLLPILGMCLSYENDEGTKWIAYAISLPGGIAGYVKSKFLFPVILMLAGALFSHVYACIFDRIAGEALMTSLDFWVILMSAGVGMLICAFYYPFVFRFGLQKGNVFGTVLLFCGILAGYIYIMFGDLSIWKREDMPEYIMRWIGGHIHYIKIITCASFLLGIAAILLSYRIVIKIFRKGAALTG
ncbi:MAG: ABC-2 transporter permease [Lachnospiraceae bacterium]|nr:ABC-2 transporter permease [Lachnospiraceae bacterium]